MPYQRESANKSSHFDIIKNPDVAHFLDNCDFIKQPSDEEAQELCSLFTEPPSTVNVSLPEYIIAVDGSTYESSIDDRLPSTKVGFVKIGCMLIDMGKYNSLRTEGGRFVDPFRVAELQDSNSPLTFTLPSANIRWNNKGNVRDSFRASIDEQLYGVKTRFNEKDPSTSLRTTLFHLASDRPGKMRTGDPKRLKIHKCPNCEEGPLEVMDVPEQQYCPHCGGEIYPSDCLRLWEEISDFQSNIQALNRFMMVVEHLVPIHYIRHLEENSLSSLGSIAFFIDGPLAIFGNSAWLHASIMRYLSRVNQRLAKVNESNILMIGLQKTGQIADYMNTIDRFLPANRIYILDDDYRYKYIYAGREPAKNGFGAETYYGQDFIYKTPSGRTFIFSLPYPFENKELLTDGIQFMQAKTEIERYTELPRALALIQNFECDLYENAVVPIALAHRYTSISLVPGGRVLDLLTREALLK